MATVGTSGSEKAIRALLALAIIGLLVWLYFVTVVPAQKAEAANREAALSRQRMSDIRTALITFRDNTQRYPTSLDSLAAFAATDSLFQARAAEGERKAPFSADSMLVTPTSGKRYLYELTKDSTGLELYWLGSPDLVGDSVGARDPNPAYRNAASWE